MRLHLLMVSGLMLVAVPRSAPLRAQSRPDSVTVAADSSFLAGALHRWLFGSDYRKLWAEPVRVEVLDLGRYGGGLTPTRKGGGLQTLSLRFRGADGREYAFRSVRKNPEGIIPEDLRGTFVEGVVRDQMSSIHPGGALIVPPILEAAGVPHSPPLLRVMPDDPRLGEFRAEFAGMLGTIEERPTEADDDHPAFLGASDIKDTWEMYEEVNKHAEVRPDTRAYLTARLVDLFVGDWDRHEDQWLWALVGEGDRARWLPIPRDRDQAFARYDGLLWSIARIMAPQLLNFDEDYADPAASTWNGRFVDRRVLVDLEWPVWDSVATALQADLTDQVIDRAVDQLPPTFRARDGERLRRVLRIRRDKLPEAARDFYRYLARRVDVRGGNDDDWAVVERGPEGRTVVQVGRRGGGDQPYFTRAFLPQETGEIRLYMGAEDDQVTIRGENGGPLVRVIGQGGRDTLVAESRDPNAKFYDHGDGTVVEGAPLSRKEYVQPNDTNPLILPERDWGHRFIGAPRLVVNSDVGLALGYGFVRRSYGFRRQPYANQHTASFDWSFQRSDFRARLGSRWKVIQSDTYITSDILVSGLEGLRFYGFGNGTVGEAPDDDIFLVRQKAFAFSPGFGFGLEGPAKLHFTVRARHTVTDPDDPDNAAAVIGQVQPLGFDEFGQLGFATTLEWDTRDYPFAATRGLHMVAEGDVYPVTWSRGEGTFGSVEGSISTYLTPISPATFAFRVGGRKVWGDFPYFEAAYLGAAPSLRGYPRNRFAGDAAVFGNAELRLKLTRANIVLPGELGVFGLADAGRVFYPDDLVESWHTDAGGGIWYAVLDRSFAFSLGVAQGDEKARFYLLAGMGF